MNATTTRTAKVVQVLARIQFKADPRKVVYLVRSSNGADIYQTCLFNGKATSCVGCPATRPCYHMSGCEALEAARTAQQSAEAEETERCYRSLAFDPIFA